jgi:hypothetical protein
MKVPTANALTPATGDRAKAAPTRIPENLSALEFILPLVCKIYIVKSAGWVNRADYAIESVFVFFLL